MALRLNELVQECGTINWSEKLGCTTSEQNARTQHPQMEGNPLNHF